MANHEHTIKMLEDRLKRVRQEREGLVKEIEQAEASVTHARQSLATMDEITKDLSDALDLLKF